MAKKIFYQVPINYEGEAIIKDPAQYEAIDSAIKRGQICLDISLNYDSTSMGNGVYSDQVEGQLSFERKGDRIQIKAHCTKKFPYDKSDDFPLTLLLSSVSDATPDSYYFNDAEEPIATGVVIASPV